jgi:type IV pilus assembly protein PilM
MSLFSRTKTTVGLDIGSSLIKLAIIDHTKGIPELTKVALTPVLPDAIVEGEIMDPALVTDAIRTTIDAIDTPIKSVVTAVSGRDVIIKRIQTERVKPAQAREVIRLEAEQHVPDVESVEIDFQILDADNFDDEMSVLFVAAKRDLIDAKVRIVGDAGLNTGIVDVEAFALHNAFEFNHPDALSGGTALVNIGNEITNVTILDNGTPILSRDIPVGTRRFREDLQYTHALTPDEAEATIRGNARTAQLNAVLENRCEEIASGIERAATFLATSGKSATQVTTVYICGGGSRTPGLADILGRCLNLPIRQANPLENLLIRDGAFDMYAIDEIAPLLMVPIGLALRHM